MGTGYTNYWGSMWDSNWEWQLKFTWIPRKTYYDKWVWLSKVYRGVRIIHGPGTPVILYQYMTPKEFTWHRLISETVK